MLITAIIFLCPGPLSGTLSSFLGSTLCSHGSALWLEDQSLQTSGYAACLGEEVRLWSPNTIESLFPKVYRMLFVVVVQLLSCTQLFAIPWATACPAPLSSALSLSLLRFVSVESVMLSNLLILCCPLLLFSLFQHQGLFQRVNSLHQVAKLLKLQHQSFQWIFRVDFL